MRALLKAGIGVLILAVCLLAFFSENIAGYYRFRELCKTQAGLQVSQRLQSNVGWSVEGSGIWNAALPLSFQPVSFVRYRNGKDGKLYDVYRVPMLKVGDPGYAESPADIGKDVVYRFEVKTVARLPSESRLGAQYFNVYDAKTGEAQVRYSRFGYTKFDQDRTIFGALSGEECPEDIATRDARTGKQVPSALQVAFESAFRQ